MTALSKKLKKVKKYDYDMLHVIESYLMQTTNCSKFVKKKKLHKLMKHAINNIIDRESIKTFTKSPF